MNQKVTLPKAARLIAESTGLGVRQCEDFLKGLAEIITESLSEGEQVKVKGLGTFRVTQVEGRKSVDVSTGEPNRIAGHTKVVFIPNRELAAKVNAPFEFFEAVEIGENVDESDLEDIVNDEAAVTGATPDAPEIEVEIEETGDCEVETEEFDTVESEETETSEPDTEVAEEINKETSAHEPDTEVAEDINEETEAHEPDTEVAEDINEEKEISEEDKGVSGVSHEEMDIDKDRRERKTHRFGWGFITGFGACLCMIALGIGIGLVMLWMRSKEERTIQEAMVVEEVRISVPEESQAASELPAVKDEKQTDAPVDESKEKADGAVVATSASDKEGTKVEGQENKDRKEPVYDTISKTRYLTTMAKEHYGDFNLWPYIYEENKAILGHPDRIRPGTKVVIPPLSKYGVTGSPQDIAKAKRLGIEIYARYK